MTGRICDERLKKRMDGRRGTADKLAALSFKGTIFHVWKGNQPCRIHVEDGRVYFIRRKVGGINPGTAAALGGQFGMIGGLAAGIAGAAKAKTSPDLVDDNDPTPPDQLLAKHAGNYAIAASDIVDPRIEPKGKAISFGPNAGRWHFTRRGDDKETVVLLESPRDASHAVFLLGRLLGSRLRNNSDIAGRDAETDLVTNIPLPPDQAEIVRAMNALTQLLGDRAPAASQKVRCEVRAALRESPKPLEILIGDGDRPDELRRDSDPAVYDAALRLARKLSSSVRTFPGVAIVMDRLEEGRWHINMKLMDKREDTKTRN
jgi:hypothetical protein